MVYLVELLMIDSKKRMMRVLELISLSEHNYVRSKMIELIDI